MFNKLKEEATLKKIKELLDTITYKSFEYNYTQEEYNEIYNLWSKYYNQVAIYEKLTGKDFYMHYDGKYIASVIDDPIQHEINTDILETLNEKKEYYTPEEAETLIKWTVNNTRDNIMVTSNVDTLYGVDLTGACGISQFSSLYPLEKLGLPITINNVSDMGGETQGRHAYGTVTIPILIDGEIVNKIYLIDVTYSQFFHVERSNTKYKDCGYYMNLYPQTKTFAEDVIRNGFFEATPENLRMYAYGFNGQTNTNTNYINITEEFDYDEEEFIDFGCNLDIDNYLNNIRTK